MISLKCSFFVSYFAFIFHFLNFKSCYCFSMTFVSMSEEKHFTLNIFIPKDFEVICKGDACNIFISKTKTDSITWQPLSRKFSSIICSFTCANVNWTALNGCHPHFRQHTRKNMLFRITQISSKSPILTPL